MSEFVVIALGICAVLVLVCGIVVLVVWKKKKSDELQEPNYQTFYMLGMSFIPIGIVFMITVSPAFIAFMGLGICYMAIGLARRDKWGKPG